MPIIYKITNITNNKAYVGLTVRSIEQRWKGHVSSARQGSPYRFHSAIRKYGIDSWKLEVLFEHENHTICREKEDFFIQHYELNDSKKGYNAKPGGCGGWIVPKEKYNDWKRKISITNQGLNNGNSTKYTNEELVEIGIKISNDLKRIPGHRTMVSECAKRDIRFPKSFRVSRFDGKYYNFAKILEDRTGLIFKPLTKTQEWKEKIRSANVKNRISRND